MNNLKSFNIPKLNSLSDNSPLKSTEINNYTSLSDLANSQLSSTKFRVPNIFKNSNSNKFSLESNPIAKLSSNICQLNINASVTNTKSLDNLKSNEKGLNEEWLIDLSKSLKTVNSQPIMKHSKSPLSLIDARDLTHKKVEDKITFTPFHVNRNIIKIRYKIDKKVSNFGRILCSNFNRSIPKVISNDAVTLSKMKRFAFTVPSPDDVIQRNLRLK